MLDDPSITTAPFKNIFGYVLRHHIYIGKQIILSSMIVTENKIGKPEDFPNRRRMRLKRDGSRTETRFRLSPKWTSPFKSVGASVQSTAGSQGVRISVSNV